MQCAINNHVCYKVDTFYYAYYTYFWIFFTQLLKVIWIHNNHILQAMKSDREYTRKNLRNILTWIISGFLHLTSQDNILDKCQRNYVAVCYWWSTGWYSLFWKVIMMRKPYFKGHSHAVTARVWKVLAMTRSIEKPGERQTARNKSYIIYNSDKEDTWVINKYWFRHIKTLDAHLLLCYIIYLNLTDMFHDNTETVSQNFTTTTTAQKLTHKKSAMCYFQCLSS